MEDTPSTMRNYLEQAPRSRIPERAVVDLVLPTSGSDVGVMPEPAQSRASLTDQAWFRFSSGTDGSLAQQEFVLLVNARDFERARVILAEKEEEFTRFQRNMSCWVLSMLEGGLGGAAVPTWRRRAELYTVSRVQRAAVFENYAFMALRSGDWSSAKQLCNEGIQVCPTVEGLWVNLLVAMDRLGEEDAIDLLVVKLASHFDLERGFLGRYLANDPAFRVSTCNGG
jgi:hypothetical protein